MKKALSILLATTLLLGVSSTMFSANAIFETSNRWDKDGVTYAESGVSEQFNVTDNSIELNSLNEATWFALKEDITAIGQDDSYTFEGTLHVTEKAITAENWDGINLVFRGADNNNSAFGKAAYIKLFSNGGSSYYSSTGGLTTDNGVPFLTGADTNIVGKDLNFRIRYTPTRVTVTINGVELYNEDITNSADLKNAKPRIGIMSQKVKYKVTNINVYTDQDVPDTRWNSNSIIYSEAALESIFKIEKNSVSLKQPQASNWIVLKEDVSGIGQTNSYTFEGKLKVTSKDATAASWDGIGLVFRGDDNYGLPLGKAAYIKLFSAGGSSYYTSNGGLTTDNGVPFLTGADTDIVGKDLNFRIRYTPTKVTIVINGVVLYNEDITNSIDLKNAKPRIGIMAQKVTYDITDIKVYTDEDVPDTRWSSNDIVLSEPEIGGIITTSKNSVSLKQPQASNWIVLKEDISGIGQTDSYTFEGKLKVTSKDATAANWEGIGLVFRGADNNDLALGKAAYIKLFSGGGSSYYTSNGGLTTDNGVPFLTGVDTNIVGKDLNFRIRYTPTRVIVTINGVVLYNEDITNSVDLKNAKPRIGIMAQKVTYDITDIKVNVDGFGDFKATEDIITNVQPGTAVSDCLSAINPSEYVDVDFANKSGSPISGIDKITTGSKVDLTINGEIIRYTFVIYGDVDENGLIELQDLVEVRNYLLEINPINTIKKQAGNLYKENDITLNSLVGLMAYVSESGNISQNR